MISMGNVYKTGIIVLSLILINALYSVSLQARQPDRDYIYEYDEEGFKGELRIKKIDNTKYSVKISTLNDSNSATCEGEEVCLRKNDKLFCKIVDENYPEQTITILGFGNNIINIESDMQLGYMCGMNGYFDGKYKLITNNSPTSTFSPAASQQTGPVIFGLYLGMNYESAVKRMTAEGYEIKYFKVNDNFRKTSLTPVPYSYHILKNGKQIGRFETQLEKGIIFEFALSPSVFGVKDYEQLNFAKQFLDHYKIPYSQNMFSVAKGDVLVLTNRQDGYEITFPSSGHGFFVIRSVQKNSDIQFK